jgi:hypothetical protein
MPPRKVSIKFTFQNMNMFEQGTQNSKIFSEMLALLSQAEPPPQVISLVQISPFLK